MTIKTEFLCLNCGSTDRGTYCSNCRHPLRVSQDQFSTLLAKRLIKCYYVDLKSNGELPFPYKELKIKLTMLPEQSEQLLAFDGVFRANRCIQVIAVIATSQKSGSDIAKLAKEACILLRAERKKLFPGIKFIWLTFYLLFEDNHPPDYLKQVKKSLSLKYRMGFVKYKGSIGIDVRPKRIYGSRFPCPELIETQSALRQIGEGEMDETAEEKTSLTVRKAVWEALRTQVFQRSIDFLKTWVSLATNPSLLAKRLADDKLEVSEPIKFYFGSTVIVTTIVGLIIGSKSQLPVVCPYPVLAELLTCLFWLFVVTIWVPLEHVVLKIAKGKGKFRHAFFAKLYTMGITLPIITLIEGIALKLQVSEDTKRLLYIGAIPMLNFQFAVPFMSICYKISPNKILKLFFVIVPLFILVIVLLIVLIGRLY